jgi:hypothetical protein
MYLEDYINMYSELSNGKPAHRQPALYQLESQAPNTPTPCQNTKSPVTSIHNQAAGSADEPDEEYVNAVFIVSLWYGF